MGMATFSLKNGKVTVSPENIPGVTMHGCNPSTWETEAEGSQI
jgi:hypothetical protein